MIVADTCLIIHLFNETPLTPLAQKILKRDPCWIVPLLWQEEYANVLSKLAKQEARDPEEVLDHFEDTVKELAGAEMSVNNRRALQLSLEFKISVYDAHFVSLALDFGISLVTEDKEVLKHCRPLAMSMEHFLKSDRLT